MRICIVGAGAWGTTIGILLARKGHEVTLWARDAARALAMEQARENASYLPGHAFPDALHVISGALGDADILVGSVPTQHMRAVFTSLELPDAPFVSLSKGIEIGTGVLPTEIFRAVAGADRHVAVLTGPCIAREIARGLPTAAVVAGDDAGMLQDAFSTDSFRVYTSPDRVGAELAGALKNVLAIAAGIVDGMGLGDNTKATLLTRGIVEITRLGTRLGAQAQTFTGLAGFGDLFVTCVSPHSRNRTTGERIGRGEDVDAILASMHQVAEGVPTTQAALGLAAKHGVEMPITKALHSILFEGVSVDTALNALMTRGRGAE